MRQSDSVEQVKPSPDALDRIVQQKVAEIMAGLAAENETAALEPFFRSRQIAYEIKRLQTVPEQESWHVFFQRQGCLHCHSKDRLHGGAGMCVRCYPRILRQKQAIIKELMTGLPSLPARGATEAQRHLLRCWQRHTTATEKGMYGRIAKELDVTTDHVREVDRGGSRSARVAAALKKERKKHP